ncbi:helix-turn-helix transcriptional regulator [Haemophilus influenzae]|jgi:hypothetical protein|uniref:XRE family transcriptional regulator n=2 Tax=Haemophilus haemolyticus TaxID=726 RepID=A0A502JV00_HAEHA|nr:helix-turn-helix transcriptional regulator [Haemophilus influenzae]EGT77548.1 putative lambda repressor-like, DNA-binding protein [Haemophilus haemolyticus M21127]NYA24990.1 helix-turn-helix transcriptional regulator [Haemophilus haemolyticus]DAM53620.1 MAG TPA: helix-turn-helix domain protein [Caudoviricetes sp.]PRI84655.1 Helix-turn-helix domain protein [Haemophilus influenzae]PRI90448.1 Helix-turn-helix domain protein [Haemophilus influenzae]
MVQFSQMLKNERMRLGLTQDEIARFCGVSKRTYNYYEDGERAASSDFLMAFSKLGADINYLFTGERTKESLEPLERTVLLAFNRLVKDGQKTSAITFMTMLEAGLIKGDFNTLWEQEKNLQSPTALSGQTVSNSIIENVAGRDINIGKK